MGIVAGLIGFGVLALMIYLIPVWTAWFVSPKGRLGGGLGPVLSELNAIIQPAERQVEIARRRLPAERTNDEPQE